ncbi:uncharacterized protein EI90DRAFT_2906513 [Cantharellus anzutake]|uniref:uncharacterized protein n=1 Tax=Cantharellus anzutake TaxID=1750568 RepID=UPI001903CBC1|nr:uncharacterized protein EI90DRAFT_2906513 [Cantharellus anzutake]KAF8340358.1 hypothetical protein EI90DRAFT_2906513 [Cantharellus anzutake]
MSTPNRGRPFTDVSRRAPLDTGRLRSARPPTQAAEEERNSEEYLTQMEEDWNKRVDTEIDTLVSDMVTLAEIASIEDKDRLRASQEAFQTICRAESMVSAASSLLSITHSLKLLFLLADEQEIANRRAQEMVVVREQIAEAQEWTIKGWETLLSSGSNS